MVCNTHLGIDQRLCGRPTALSEGKAEAQLTTTDDMVADDRGLVHGGFIFGLADYAAMLAVNDPHVVLGAAQTRFLMPVRRGETVTATAEVVATKGRKNSVEVAVTRAADTVMTGTFTCFVLDKHVLD